jgi:hypothetical protein
MSQMKVRLEQLPSGDWKATWTAPGEPRELKEIDAGHGLSGFRVILHPATTAAQAATPWEASATVCETVRLVLGLDVSVEWETLPWEAKRVAYGITEGVCELLCASTGTQRALAKAKWERRGRSLACSWCVAPTPWNAEDIGWRWVKLELFGTWANNAWACPGCAPRAPLADPDAKTFQRGQT